MSEKIVPHVKDTGKRPKISVVIRCRNEYPVIMGTILSYVEDLEYSGYPYEIIVASNLSDDSGPDVLRDRFRRWVRAKILKVIDYDEKESTWCAANAGIEASDGKLIAVSDAHVSIKTGTMHGLAQGCLTHGGIWHPAVNKWGDVDRIRTYGFDLVLTTSFWGYPCIHLPEGVHDEVGRPRPHKIPMAGACLFLVHRKELRQFGAYSPYFGIYGGGEPYLTLKWWMLGSAVWCFPEGLCRHAFGWRARWAQAPKQKVAKNSPVYLKTGKFSREIKKGDEYLAYGKGYRRPDVPMYRNFLLAAWILGGEHWLEHMVEEFKKKLPGAKKQLVELADRIRIDGAEEREWIKKKQKRSLDDLLRDPPWLTCARHKVEDYAPVWARMK